jgi:nucleoid-associated protein YgaU
MPRKKGSTNKKQPIQETVFEKKSQSKQIDSFADMAAELKLQESYKSLLLGIAVVLLVAVLAAGYLKNRNQQMSQVTQETKIAKVAPRTDVLGVYTVQAGDDLKTISQKYYQTTDLYIVIAKENGLTNPDVVDEGKKLTIPKVEKSRFLAPLLSRPLKKDVITDTSYTVQEGDLLWDIAVRAYGDGNKSQEIVKQNNLPSAESIFPGMILQLPR